MEQLIAGIKTLKAEGLSLKLILKIVKELFDKQ